MSALHCVALLLLFASTAAAGDIFRESLEEASDRPPLVHTYGDIPHVPAFGRKADVILDDVAVEGPAVAPAALKADDKKVYVPKGKLARIVPISLIWDEGYRTLENTIIALDEAGQAGADLVCLPQECVFQKAEPIPGPTADAIAKKAAEHKMYVVGNLRELDETSGNKVYVTSFLCDRQGKIVGKYRKTHRMPFEAYPETAFELGDNLPVFQTDFGSIALKIGTDHYFSEIDLLYRQRGAALIVWSTAPFPSRDDYQDSAVLHGRAADLGLNYAVAQYAGKQGYGGDPSVFSWTATWPLPRARVIDRRGHSVADSNLYGGMAVATLPDQQLKGTPGHGGYPADGFFGPLVAGQLPAAPPRPADAKKRTVRVAVADLDTSGAYDSDAMIDRVIAKVDACGRQQCDLVCLGEFVWYGLTDADVERCKPRNQKWLARVAEAAARNKTYVVIAGELTNGFNEAILFDREGKQCGQYTKINQTTPKEMRTYKKGDKVGIFDLDFGRIAVKICADVYSPEIDRVAALNQVDLLLHPTQDGGYCSEYIRLRDISRCVDNGYYYLRAAAVTGESDHRSYIADPWGMVLASSHMGFDNAPVVATIRLDHRPKYVEWPEDVRKAGPYPDPYQVNKYPAAKGDLRAVILQQRRPDLYRARTEK